MHRLYCFLVLWCVANSTYATESWVAIPNSDPNIAFSIDQNSIERHGVTVRFWEKLVFIQPKIMDEASGKLVKEKKVHRLMHCKDNTQGVISGATYADNGRFISSVAFDEPQAAMSPIPIGSLAAEELRLVCGPASMP